MIAGGITPMAYKKTTNREVSLWEDTFEFPDGSVLEALVKIPGFQSKQQEYYNALVVSRSLPNNNEALSPRDPIVQYYTEQLKPKLQKKLASMDTVLRQVRGFYEQEIMQARTDATILAIFDNPKTVLNREAKPYTDEDSGSGASWGIKPPKIIRDLGDEVEESLKKIYDLIIEKPTLLEQVVEMCDQLAVKLNMIQQGLIEVSDAGFLTAATSATVGKEIDALVSIEDDEAVTAP